MSDPMGFETPAGLSKHTWVDRPDTKYNADGLFKTKLICDLAQPEVEDFKGTIDAAAQAVLEQETADLRVDQRKQWEPYLPYTLETDEKTGVPTGHIVFEFKRNAKVTIRKTGEVKELSVAVYDSKGKAVIPATNVPSGALIRVVGNFRPIKIAAISKAGVRMDFFAVQILRMPEGTVLGSPFSEHAVEGGSETSPTQPGRTFGEESDR